MGQHYGYVRELGEPQLTFNYCRALSDFTTNFCFGKGVSWKVPKENEAIIPSVLDRVWKMDNDQATLLWELGQTGSVTGDVFIKIAYEEPWVDPAGNAHEGRVRVLPINPSFAYPEWHPHDRDRMIRFKLKYRFYGTTLEGTRSVFCFDDQTEILTDHGWTAWDAIEDDDQALTLNPVTKVIEWQEIKSVNVFDWDGPLTRWQNKSMDALTTPNHRWLTQDWRDRDPRYQKERPWVFKTTEQLSTGRGSTPIIAGGGTPFEFADQSTFSDEMVELIGWTVAEGYYSKHEKKKVNGVMLRQSESHNPRWVERLRVLQKHFRALGATCSEYGYEGHNALYFYFGKGIGKLVRELAPNKQLTPEFLCALTEHQARLLFDTLIRSDGHTRDDGPTKSGAERRDTRTFGQLDPGRIDGFQMLSAMLGIRTHAHFRPDTDGYADVTAYHSNNFTARYANPKDEYYKGVVWCPQVENKTVFARRNGVTYWTGQTYVELITDNLIQEFINDEMISSHPNPLGEIPIVHIPNRRIASSPWGMGDLQDIIALNRQYNETATVLADIINYYSAPTTVIIGAKASQLEKGAKKVWAGLPKDAQVYNLELQSDASLAQAFLERLKQAMHEMTGVPITALGQSQPVSNTSGVALQIQYQPMMMVFGMKASSFGKGFAKVNELALKTLAIKEPGVFAYDPTTSPPLKEGQLPLLDTRDPATYRTKAHFQTPLPIDQLIKLNEIMSKMQLGLESKRGALKDLGEDHPDEKLEELLAELMQDAKEQGALELIKAEIADVIMLQTMSGGMPPEGQAAGGMAQGMAGGNVTSAGGPNVTSASDSGVPPANNPALPGVQSNADLDQIAEELSTLSAGTKIPQRRLPNSDNED